MHAKWFTRWHRVAGADTSGRLAESGCISGHLYMYTALNLQTNTKAKWIVKTGNFGCNSNYTHPRTGHNSSTSLMRNFSHLQIISQKITISVCTSTSQHDRYLLPIIRYWIGSFWRMCMSHIHKQQNEPIQYRILVRKYFHKCGPNSYSPANVCVICWYILPKSCSTSSTPSYSGRQSLCFDIYETQSVVWAAYIISPPPHSLMLPTPRWSCLTQHLNRLLRLLHSRRLWGCQWFTSHSLPSGQGVAVCMIG